MEVASNAATLLILVLNLTLFSAEHVDEMLSDDDNKAGADY
jgi:hypothetical protein